MSAALPAPAALWAAPRTRPPSAGSAESLVLAGLVLQCVFAAGIIASLIAVSVEAIVHPFTNSWVAILAVGLIAVSMLVLIFFLYTFSYRRITSGDFAAAQAPTLVIGIVSLFVGLIPGILEIIGYAKVGDAYREQQGYGPGTWLAPPPNPSLIACKGCGRVYPVGQFAYCPGCGQKLGP